MFCHFNEFLFLSIYLSGFNLFSFSIFTLVLKGIVHPKMNIREGSTLSDNINILFSVWRWAKVLRSVHTAQTNANKHQQTSLLEFVCWISVLSLSASVGVGWSLFPPGWTCLVAVCWVVDCVKWFSNKLQQTLTWPRTVSMMMRIFHLKRASPTGSFVLFAIFSGEEWHTKTLITVKFWLWLQDHQFHSQSDLHHLHQTRAVRRDKIQERF